MSLIGSGGFGKVSHVDGYAIKQGDKESIYIEYKIYKKLDGVKGIPRVYNKWKDSHGNYYLKMEMLGPNLRGLARHFGRLSKQMALGFLSQTLDTLEQIHNLGIIHRDIKPENLLIGVGDNSDQLYVVDFGLAREHRNHRKKHPHFVGTPDFCSKSVHHGNDPTYSDDLECLFLSFYYSLYRPVNTHIYKVKDYKEFNVLIGYCRSLNWGSLPDYSYVRDLITASIN